MGLICFSNVSLNFSEEIMMWWKEVKREEKGKEQGLIYMHRIWGGVEKDFVTEVSREWK